jgi:hypothetical protein
LITLDREQESRSTGGSATATATAGEERLSGGAHEATQHLNDANGEHPGAFALGCGSQLAHRAHVDDSGGLRGAAPGHLVGTSLVRTRSSAGALGDVEHDAQARSFELISERAVLTTRLKSTYPGVGLERELVNLEPLVLQPWLAAAGSIARVGHEREEFQPKGAKTQRRYRRRGRITLTFSPLRVSLRLRAFAPLR